MSQSGDPFIPIARPLFDDAEERAVAEVLRSGWVSQGPRVAELEAALATFLGCRYVRAVNSGTSALLLALKSVGIGPGDSVIVPAFTCAATALPVLALGARPVFVDVEVPTLHTTWWRIEAALRPDTKAVLLVHLFGRVADAVGIAASCRERGVALVEDACLALGARQAGKAAGTSGTAGCFSFHPRKIITTGEGGAVCTDDEALAQGVERDRSYGAAVSAWARLGTREGSLRGFDRLAFNLKLTDLQAAIGLVQMQRLPAFLEQRREVAAAYRRGLADVPGLTLPPAPAAEEEDACQAFVCLWTPEPMERLMRDAQARNAAIASREVLRGEVTAQGVAFSDAAQCLPELPVFRAHEEEAGIAPDVACPAAAAAARLSFALPVFPGMAARDVERVVRAVRAGAARAWADRS